MSEGESSLANLIEITQGLVVLRLTPLVEFAQLLLQFPCLGVSASKLGAILEDNQFPIDFVAAISGRRASDGNYVTGFERIVKPAATSQDGRRIALAR